VSRTPKVFRTWYNSISLLGMCMKASRQCDPVDYFIRIHQHMRESNKHQSKDIDSSQFLHKGHTPEVIQRADLISLRTILAQVMTTVQLTIQLITLDEDTEIIMYWVLWLLRRVELQNTGGRKLYKHDENEIRLFLLWSWGSASANPGPVTGFLSPCKRKVQIPQPNRGQQAQVKHCPVTRFSKTWAGKKVSPCCSSTHVLYFSPPCFPLTQLINPTPAFALYIAALAQL
jgi:hypothetical protein